MELASASDIVYLLQIKQKAKGTMSGPNGALVPGPGGNHNSAQNNQMVDNELQNQTGGQGNLSRGFDQGSMGQGFEQGNLGTGFDSNSGSGSYGSGYGSGKLLLRTLLHPAVS